MKFAREYISEIVLDEAELLDVVKNLALRIENDYAGKTPLLLGILDGVIPFLGDLSRRIALPVQTGYLKYSLYGDSLCPETKKKSLTLVTDVDLRGAEVILVDDMCDSGRTLEAAARWVHAQGVASLRTAVLLRRAIETVRFEPDYIGSERAEKEWFVGYGFDYKGLLRNLPYVGLLKEEYQNR